MKLIQIEAVLTYARKTFEDIQMDKIQDITFISSFFSFYLNTEFDTLINNIRCMLYSLNSDLRPAPTGKGLLLGNIPTRTYILILNKLPPPLLLQYNCKEGLFLIQKHVLQH